MVHSRIASSPLCEATITRTSRRNASFKKKTDKSKLSLLPSLLFQVIPTTKATIAANGDSLAYYKYPLVRV